MTIKELVLNAEARAEVDAAKNVGHRYVQRVPVSTRKGACPNCGGLEQIWIDFIKRGPTPILPGCNYKGGERATWLELDGKKGWFVVKGKRYDCPLCSDPRAKQDYLWRYSGLEINERGWKVNFIDNMAGKEQALSRAHDILTAIPDPKGWVTLHGNFGVGKSGLMKAIVAQSVLAGVSSRYVRAADILVEIRSSYGDRDDVTEDEISEKYAGYQVLAVDEVDRIGDTNWSISTLMMALDRRYTRRFEVATILATNNDPENMPDGFGYLASRMKDGDRIQVGGKDLRG